MVSMVPPYVSNLQDRPLIPLPHPSIPRTTESILTFGVVQYRGNKKPMASPAVRRGWTEQRECYSAYTLSSPPHSSLRLHTVIPRRTGIQAVFQRAPFAHSQLDLTNPPITSTRPRRLPFPQRLITAALQLQADHRLVSTRAGFLKRQSAKQMPHAIGIDATSSAFGRISPSIASKNRRRVRNGQIDLARRLERQHPLIHQLRHRLALHAEQLRHQQPRNHGHGRQ